MKKFIALLCLIFFINPPKIVIASEQAYSRVMTTNTGFYSDANGNYLKFNLPYTYYVKIIEIGDIYTKVSFMETGVCPMLSGYIKTVDIIGVNYVPLNPYPIITLTAIKDDILFGDYELSNTKLAVYANTTATYYGEISSPQGENLIYVYCNGYLGYVRKSAFAPFEIPLNPDYEKEEELETSPNTPTDKKTQNMQILIIAGISIVVVSFVYVIFKPNAKRITENEED